MSFLSRLLSISLLLLAAGCAGMDGPVRTYDGPPRAEDEVAIISAPPTLEIIRVDGRKIKLPFTEGAYDVHLLPGKHRIRSAYRELWGDATNSLFVRSDDVIFDVEVSAGQRLRLDFPPPRDLAAAQGFADDPRIWLEDAGTGERIEPIDIVAHGGLLGMMTGGEPEAPAAPPASAPDSTAAAESALLEQDALERLKFWWKLAEKDERAAFEQWVSDQD